MDYNLQKHTHTTYNYFGTIFAYVSSMDTETRYPHLTQKGGAWIVVQLDDWKYIKNHVLPLRLPKQALDDKILVKFRYEYEKFRDFPNEHIDGQQSVSIRSPYSNTQPIYTIHSARAILSMWLDFSYHNWMKFPSNLGKMCDSPGCINPRHYELGKRRNRLVPVSLDLPDVDLSIPVSDADWADLEHTVLALVSEAREVGDDPAKIIAAVTDLATQKWGPNRPLPSRTGWSSIRELVAHAVSPTGETPKPKSATYVSTEEIQSWLDRKE